MTSRVYSKTVALGPVVSRNGLGWGRRKLGRALQAVSRAKYRYTSENLLRIILKFNGIIGFAGRRREMLRRPRSNARIVFKNGGSSVFETQAALFWQAGALRF
jgi:hypothetical protein